MWVGVSGNLVTLPPPHPPPPRPGPLSFSRMALKVAGQGLTAAGEIKLISSGLISRRLWDDMIPSVEIRAEWCCCRGVVLFGAFFSFNLLQPPSGRHVTQRRAEEAALRLCRLQPLGPHMMERHVVERRVWTQRSLTGSRFALHIAVSCSGARLPSPTDASMVEQVAGDQHGAHARIASSQKNRGPSQQGVFTRPRWLTITFTSPFST